MKKRIRIFFVGMMICLLFGGCAKPEDADSGNGDIGNQSGGTEITDNGNEDAAGSGSQPEPPDHAAGYGAQTDIPDGGTLIYTPGSGSQAAPEEFRELAGTWMIGEYLGACIPPELYGNAEEIAAFRETAEEESGWNLGRVLDITEANVSSFEACLEEGFTCRTGGLRKEVFRLPADITLAAPYIAVKVRFAGDDRCYTILRHAIENWKRYIPSDWQDYVIIGNGCYRIERMMMPLDDYTVEEIRAMDDFALDKLWGYVPSCSIGDMHDAEVPAELVMAVSENMARGLTAEEAFGEMTVEYEHIEGVENISEFIAEHFQDNKSLAFYDAYFIQEPGLGIKECYYLDIDNDGWKDLLLVTWPAHIYRFQTHYLLQGREDGSFLSTSYEDYAKDGSTFIEYEGNHYLVDWFCYEDMTISAVCIVRFEGGRFAHGTAIYHDGSIKYTTQGRWVP